MKKIDQNGALLLSFEVESWRYKNKNKSFIIVDTYDREVDLGVSVLSFVWFWV